MYQRLHLSLNAQHNMMRTGSLSWVGCDQHKHVHTSSSTQAKEGCSRHNGFAVKQGRLLSLYAMAVYRKSCICQQAVLVS